MSDRGGGPGYVLSPGARLRDNAWLRPLNAVRPDQPQGPRGHLEGRAAKSADVWHGECMTNLNFVADEDAESLANAVGMAALVWSVVEESWKSTRPGEETANQIGTDFMALRLWLALVFVGFETWHDISDKYPSEKLSTYWDDPLRVQLGRLRNKTFHHGGSLLPKQVADFWDRPDAIRWASHVMAAVADVAAEHFLGWDELKRRSGLA